MNNVTLNEGKAALERLLQVADGDSGQETRVRGFLLSWWNAGAFGGFDPTDLWTMDNALARDVVAVLALIVQCRAYPDAMGYRQAFDWLIVHWHSELIAPEERACARYRPHFERLAGLG